MGLFYNRWLRLREANRQLRAQLEYWVNMSKFWEDRYSHLLDKYPEIIREQKGGWVNGKSDGKST